MIDPAIIADIRSRVPILSVVGVDVRLTQRGTIYTGLCPFHAERTPSFVVRPDRGTFRCYGCGEKGHAIDYLMARGRGFLEAVAQLADMAGVALPGMAAPTKPLAPVVKRDPEREGRDQARDRERAMRIWERARPGRRTLVETYLRDGRGLDLDRIGGLPACLRYDPRCELWVIDDGQAKARLAWTGPAMVAPLVTGDRKVIGLLRTWLERDGSWRLTQVDGTPIKGKKMLGAHMGAVVPLAERAPRMQGAEGIETSLSGWCAVPELPAVALASLANFSGNMEGKGGWQPWDGLLDFTWLSDADGKAPPPVRPGQKARLTMDQIIWRGLQRLARGGVITRNARPPPGLDGNDLYRAA